MVRVAAAGLCDSPPSVNDVLRALAGDRDLKTRGLLAPKS